MNYFKYSIIPCSINFLCMQVLIFAKKIAVKDILPFLLKLSRKEYRIV